MPFVILNTTKFQNIWPSPRQTQVIEGKPKHDGGKDRRTRVNIMQNWSTRISKCTQTNVSTDERQRINENLGGGALWYANYLSKTVFTKNNTFRILKINYFLLLHVSVLICALDIWTARQCACTNFVTYFFLARKNFKMIKRNFTYGFD
jgi:hypothetical protein